MTEYTFSIIKPDATERNLTGSINSYIEKAGLKIVAQKMTNLTHTQAEEFYGVHRDRPFFGDLVNYMLSGPVVLQVLKGTDAVKKYRDVMGATNPEDADAGTIRKDFAVSIEANSVHGSDSLENAKIEISYFFAQSDLVE